MTVVGPARSVPETTQDIECNPVRSLCGSKKAMTKVLGLKPPRQSKLPLTRCGPNRFHTTQLALRRRRRQIHHESRLQRSTPDHNNPPHARYTDTESPLSERTPRLNNLKQQKCRPPNLPPPTPRSSSPMRASRSLYGRPRRKSTDKSDRKRRS